MGVAILSEIDVHFRAATVTDCRKTFSHDCVASLPHVRPNLSISSSWRRRGVLSGNWGCRPAILSAQGHPAEPQARLSAGAIFDQCAIITWKFNAVQIKLNSVPALAKP